MLAINTSSTLHDIALALRASPTTDKLVLETLDLLDSVIARYGIKSSSPLIKFSNTSRVNSLLCYSAEGLVPHLHVDTCINKVYLYSLCSYMDCMLVDYPRIPRALLNSINSTFKPVFTDTRFYLVDCTAELLLLREVVNGGVFRGSYCKEKLGFLVNLIKTGDSSLLRYKQTVLNFLSERVLGKHRGSFTYSCELLRVSRQENIVLSADMVHILKEYLGQGYCLGWYSQDEASALLSKI